jgi:hypothetical protein
MKLTKLTLLIVFLFTQLNAQDSTFTVNSQMNSAQTLINNNDGKFRMAGYGEINYNQDFKKDIRSNAKLDIQRLVLLFGYNFDKRTSFVTEVEYEHVKEVFIEQAFVNYRVNTALNFMGGLLLVPMGIINEYHEPTTFYGVERPLTDKVLAPTTWREIGVGISGNFLDYGLSYQLYALNGFLGYNGSAKFSSASGYRGGRQKGAESTMSSPNISAKVNYYGIRGLKLGLSAYIGKSQSTLFDGLDESNELLVNQADSSVINLTMIGFDLQYRHKAFRASGQFIYGHNGNANAYNEFAKSDIGDSMLGYYIQGAYDVFYTNKAVNPLCIFARYEQYDTQYKWTENLSGSPDAKVNEFTIGLDYTLSEGVVLKSDYQITDIVNREESRSQLNFGIGFWFK